MYIPSELGLWYVERMNDSERFKWKETGDGTLSFIGAVFGTGPQWWSCAQLSGVLEWAMTGTEHRELELFCHNSVKKPLSNGDLREAIVSNLYFWWLLSFSRRRTHLKRMPWVWRKWKGKDHCSSQWWVLGTEWHGEMGTNECIHRIMAALDSVWIWEQRKEQRFGHGHKLMEKQCF